MKQHTFSVKSPPTLCITTAVNYVLDMVILLLIPKVLGKLLHVANHPWMVVIQHLFYLYHVSKIIKLFLSGQKWQNVCTVRVLPFGVQIEERTISVTTSSNAATRRNSSCNGSIIKRFFNGNRKGPYLDDPDKVTFIPIECILDVVVLEIVLSYNVFSVVAFRIDKNGMINKSVGERLQESSLAIAFHPDKVHMTHVECLQMWKGIKEAIRIST